MIQVKEGVAMGLGGVLGFGFAYYITLLVMTSTITLGGILIIAVFTLWSVQWAEQRKI